jgi:putative membrane protein
MRSSRLAVCGALCSLLAVLSACAHDDTQPAAPQTSYYPPSTATTTSAASPTDSQTTSSTPPATTSALPADTSTAANTPPSTGTTGTTATMGATNVQGGAPPSDDDIAAIVETINKTEIDAAKLATSRAQSGEVKAFAKMMIDDHSTALHKETALFTREHLTPNTSSPTSQMLMSDAQQEASTLQQKTGSDFDQSYMDAMVQGHQEALALIDDTLLPNAKDAELKSHLQSLREHVEKHLHKATSVQGRVGGIH